MIKKFIKNNSFVVFDIETTGFSPEQDQIIEIGAVKLDNNGNVIDTFDQFVDLYLCETLPEKIVELTHITDEMLQNEGNPLAKVMEEFYEFFKDSILIAQNAKFDLSFIDYYYLNKGIFLPNIVLDTIDLGKFLYPQKKSYALKKLMEYFEIEYDSEAHHRADYDALITSKIFVSGMKNLINEKKLEKIIEFHAVFQLEEATINQKRYLFSLLNQNDITLKEKIYLSKFNASRQIGILSNKK